MQTLFLICASSPIPFISPDLRPHSGLDPDVKDFVFSYERVCILLDKIVDMVTFVGPYFLEQDKKQLVIGIGCTGGHAPQRRPSHRNCMIGFLKTKAKVYLEHRDLNLEKAVRLKSGIKRRRMIHPGPACVDLSGFFPVASP